MSRLVVESLEIRSLWHNRDVTIPIRDNCLILIGENGSGKSTILKVLYYLLSAQFSRLLEVDFESVAIVLNGQRIEITREQLQYDAQEGRSSALRHLPTFLRKRANRFLDVLPALVKQQKTFDIGEFVADASRQFDLPTSLVYDLIGEMGEREGVELVASPKDLFGADRARASIKDLVGNTDILYFPTYRRIERDLKRLFPSLKDDPAKRDRRVHPSQHANHADEIAFGMQDVHDSVSHQTLRIERSVRQHLNDVAVQYLRDAILGEYKQQHQSLEDLDDAAWEQMLERFPIGLGEQGSTRLKGIATKVRTGEPLNTEERLVAHYLTLLIGVWRHQRHLETDVRAFTSSCNKYLVDKRLEYDDSSFEIVVKDIFGLSPEARGRPIEWGALSSGEQQIVSLFSRLMLTGHDRYLLLVDEPELSLSVTWQPMLLPDIRSSARCEGVFAVTHSPFIYDNELGRHASVVHEHVRPTTSGPRDRQELDGR